LEVTGLAIVHKIRGLVITDQELWRTVLLTMPEDQAKLKKTGEGGVYAECGLQLNCVDCNLPLSGSTPACRAGCLITTTRNAWAKATFARMKRSRMLKVSMTQFYAKLSKELRSFVRWCKNKGLLPVCRLNVMSSVRWEEKFPQIFWEFPEIQFLDYTKDEPRFIRYTWKKEPFNLISNYHLTFSRSELNDSMCLELLEEGGTVFTPVLKEAKPKLLAEGWRGFPCWDGDLHDRRWEDPAGHWVLGTAKGKAVLDCSGWVIR
jgi:hypothetical protein